MRIRPNLVPYSYKSPPKQLIDFQSLHGGLNLWDLEYKLHPSQSPNMLNLHWKDGALSSRRGQMHMYEGALGSVVAATEHPYYDQVIFHAGQNLYRMKPETGEYTLIKEAIGSEVGGSFFTFGDFLYYKTAGVYLKITSGFVASNVDGYVPLMVINLKPDATGGSLQQSENRISRYKRFQYTADGTATVYYIPITQLDTDFTPVVSVNGAVVTAFTVDYALGKITFTTAPAVGLQNNVEIMVAKTNAAALNSVMECTYAVSYGMGNDTSVVMAGSNAQPNGYFWSGVNYIADPSYFPIDYYNLAGQSDDPITGFGRQQGLLIIFKERSIGKTIFSIESVAGRDYINLPYTNINSAVGCDLPRTIAIVQNNLVFVNTSGGVYIIRDTTTANENNITRISRNVNGSLYEEEKFGLLKAVRSVDPVNVVAIDDDKHFWVVANGEAYLWDYTISSNVKQEETLSWFRLNNIKANAFSKFSNDVIYGSTDGTWTKFFNGYSDYGQPFVRRYVFAVQQFGTFDRFKTVDKVIFVTRTDDFSMMSITYRTDYGDTVDPSPIYSMSYSLVPRNLGFRVLDVIRFAKSNMRKPRCFQIKHFSMELYNNTSGSGMSLVSAQIYFHYEGVDR